MSEFPASKEQAPSNGKKKEAISRELYDKIRKRTRMLMKGKFSNLPKSLEDDIVQEVAIKIMRYGIPEYEAALTNMVKHSMINEFRKTKRTISLDTGGTEGSPSSVVEHQPHPEGSAQIEHRLLAKQVLTHMNRELESRDPVWSTIFQSYFIEHQGVNDIAREIGWKQPRTSRAIEAIRELIRQYTDQERPGQ